MSSSEERVIEEIRELLKNGKSLIVSTVDEPIAGCADRFELSDIVTESGRPCVQRVVLPDGTVICIKYADD